MEDLINGLMDQDDKKAYECLKKLEEISNQSSKVYRFFDAFVEMLDRTILISEREGSA